MEDLTNGGDQAETINQNDGDASSDLADDESE